MNLERVLDPTSPPTAPVWRPLQLSPTDGNGAVAPITLPVGCGIVSQATVTRPANTTAYLQTIGGFTPAANSEVYQPRLRGFML